ncbi:INCEA protein, partial [Bucco capensis]|nr:INCEA protein [Bucco capensis]
FKERERQRLESLRKKQEAEEQRRKKVEEEKRRRQAEMKQKREERLRKALQARERVEQMEEEKKKRMEQKILQSNEKLSHMWEEKVSEEQSKKKLSKKLEEAEARKQKVLRRGYEAFLLQEEDEFEQQEPLQKRREDEVRGKGKKVLELRNLVEQQQQEHLKERDHKQHWREKALQLESAVLTEKTRKVRSQQILCCELVRPRIQRLALKSDLFPQCCVTVQGLRIHCYVTWRNRTINPTMSQECCCMDLEFGSPKVSENNYGMDLNSDDSTDDENEPRKPVPAWAQGSQLNQAILHQYYNPVDYDQVFGLIPSPKLEDIFGKSKPRYFKRTSSAVWHSPP